LKIYIDTIGCFKNREDSERAAGILEAAGHTITDEAENADVLVLNTCGFIEDAKRESLARFFELAELKKANNPYPKLIVTGCMSQRYADELFEELPEADVIMGVNDYDRLPEIPEGFGQRILVSDGAEKILTGPRKRLNSSATAYLKIAEGCDNRCTYCAIPSIRGAYRSVPQEILIEEAKKLCDDGAKELVIVAQDVSAYGIDICGEYRLTELLKDLCAKNEAAWIRLLYCYEERITDDLIEMIAEEEKICKYIDIPLQHISNRILKNMGRRSTRESIESCIKKLRDNIPGITIRTTFMTGFPGESDKDFEELMTFAKEQSFERMGVFSFSPEEGTSAEMMPDQVPREIAEERRDILMRQQLDISLENNRKLIGHDLKVLVERVEDIQTEIDGAEIDRTYAVRADDQGSKLCHYDNKQIVYIGRTESDAPEIDNEVVFSSDKTLETGSFCTVRITDAMDYDLVGEYRGS